MQKRGFATKREALAWEHEVMLKQSSKLDMTFGNFFELYKADRKQRVKESTWESKDHVVQTKILRNKTLQEQLTGAEEEIYVLQKRIEQSRKEAAGAKKLAEEYENRVKELVPILENMEALAQKFPDDPEQILPEAGMIESGKAYREKKAKPQVEKIMNVMRSMYAEYLEMSRKFEELQKSYYWEVREEKRLSGKLREIYMENTVLKRTVKDFAYVKVVLENEEVCAIVQREKMKEQGLRKERQNRQEKYTERGR